MKCRPIARFVAEEGVCSKISVQVQRTPLKSAKGAKTGGRISSVSAGGHPASRNPRNLQVNLSILEGREKPAQAQQAQGKVNTPGERLGSASPGTREYTPDVREGPRRRRTTSCGRRQGPHEAACRWRPYYDEVVDPGLRASQNATAPKQALPPRFDSRAR